MAALGRVGSRTAQREERAGSFESPGAPRTALRPAPLEPPVSPGKGAEPPGRSLWEQICEEYDAEQPPFPEGYKIKPEVVITVSPTEDLAFHGFGAEPLHSVPPSAADSPVPCTQVRLETTNPKTCPPRDYLETFIFPVLLPGIASLLHQARKEKCFESSNWASFCHLQMRLCSLRVSGEHQCTRVARAKMETKRSGSRDEEFDHYTILQVGLRAAKSRSQTRMGKRGLEPEERSETPGSPGAVARPGLQAGCVGQSP
ncbi:IQ domain-containing protein K isoform 2-T2 [Molossus nigricans]